MSGEHYASEGFDLLDVGVAVFDDQSRLIHANPAFRQMRDYPADVCKPGATLEDLLRFNADRGDFGPGEPATLVAERIAEIRANENREIEREMADGQIVAIKYRRTPSGGMVVTFEDRTAERRAEAARKASEERYSLATRATSDGIYDWNVAEDVLYVSEPLTKILDFDLTLKASGMWAERVHPDDLPGYSEQIRAHFRGAADAVDCEYRVRGTGGAYRWIHDRGIGMRDETGRVVRMVGAVRDITGIREAEDERARIETRLVSSLATISDGILLVDADNRVQLWNDRYMQIFSDACGGIDMSDVICKGRSFFGMVREGYELGAFKPHPGGVDAWVENRVKAWDQPASQWEFELSNGNWILLNEREMPDGGRVSVYTDITELKLREAEAVAARQRFEDAIEAISSGFALYDAEDRLVLWNRRFSEYFHQLNDIFEPGVPFSKLLSTTIERGLVTDVDAADQRMIDGIIENRRAGIGTVRENRLSEGLWLQIRDHKTRDGGLVSIYTDVTDLKISEQEATAARQRFEDAIEAISSGFALYDAEDRLIQWNARFEEYFSEVADSITFERPAAEILRRLYESGVIASATGHPEDYLASVMAMRAKGSGEIRENQLNNGKWFQITDHRTKDGGLVSIFTDVTDLKSSEQEARAAQARFEEAIEAVAAGFALWDRDDRLVICNSRYRTYFADMSDIIVPGITFRDAMITAVERGLISGLGMDAEVTADKVVSQRNATTGEPREQHHSNGNWLQITDHRTAEGGIVSIYTDVTALKTREAEIASARDAAEAALADLRRAQERLIQAEKMASLGQLTAGIAHEIKNPLNFVNNFAKLSDEMMAELADVLAAPIKNLDPEIRDDAEDLLATVRENLRKIDEHGQRADSIVKNMLMHSREGPSQQQRATLNSIAEEALNLAYHGARAENPNFNIEMSTALDDAVGEIDCFPQDLLRVFLNLVTNGMYAAHQRAAGEGSDFRPTIAITTRSAPDAVTVEVRDNGSGITEEIREKIFMPFFTTKPAGEGTGLGLSLSYDIVVKQHGGDMTVESEPGAFTAFRVTLPRVLDASLTES